MGMAPKLIQLRGNRSPRVGQLEVENPNYIRHSIYGFKPDGEIVDISVSDYTGLECPFLWLQIQADKHMTVADLSKRFDFSELEALSLLDHGRYLGLLNDEIILRVNPPGPLNNLKLGLVMQGGFFISISDLWHLTNIDGKAQLDETSQMDVDFYETQAGWLKVISNSFPIKIVGDLFLNILQKYVTHIEMIGENLSSKVAAYGSLVQNVVTNCATQMEFLTKIRNIFQQLCLAADQLELCVLEHFDMCTIHPAKTSFMEDVHKEQLKSLLVKIVAVRKLLFTHSIKIDSLMSQLPAAQAYSGNHWAYLISFVFMLTIIVFGGFGINLIIPGMFMVCLLLWNNSCH